MNPSTAFARVLVDALVAHGVSEFVLAPGSRSAPLALAALAAGQRPSTDGRAFRLHVRIDERSAGFLALGLAKASRRPVAILTTSGTAVANLHPAVLEAHHAGVPLVLLTADRPPELRGVGANQTTDQIKIFGSAVRMFHDVGVPRGEPGQARYWRDVATRAVAAAAGTLNLDPGPVHLNVALAEPLLPDGSDDWPDELRGPVTVVEPVRNAGASWYQLEPGPRTVVLAGDGAGSNARGLAEHAHWPLLAEPSSGARYGPNAIGPYRLLLDSPGLGDAIERVVVLGRATLSRPVTRLLARSDVEVVVQAERSSWVDPSRRAHRVARLVVGPSLAPAARAGRRGLDRYRAALTAERADPRTWLGAWLAAGAAAERALDAVLEGEPNGPAAARAVGAALGPHDLLVAGSSSAIRDLDLAWRPDPADLRVAGHARSADDHSPRVLSNRGLSGIDGTVSTAVGAALAHDGRTVALLGDLAFLHDANGLVLGPEEPRPDLTLVVVNDDGGGLFHLLEQGAPEYADSFERVFGTPHGVDLGSLCAATSTLHAVARTTDELTELLHRRTPAIRVVEVPIRRTDRTALHERIRTAVEAAVDGLAGSAP